MGKDRVLSVDIGNNRIHFGVVEKRQVLSTLNTYLSGLEKKEREIITRWLKEKEFDSVAISSVVPETTSKLESLLERINFQGDVFHLTRETSPIPLNYEGTLGPDRIANAVAGFYLFEKPACIIDFGTAITIDRVEEDGFAGGVILPGMELQMRSLEEKTALIKDVRWKKGGVTGKNTEEAISSGVFYSIVGGIKEILKRMDEERGKTRSVVLTGGYANLFHPYTGGIVVEGLTLIGLSIAYEIHNSLRERND